MPKGQQRGNREAKKPKQAAPQAAPVVPLKTGNAPIAVRPDKKK
jgi:hypothetical protein